MPLGRRSTGLATAFSVLRGGLAPANVQPFRQLLHGRVRLRHPMPDDYEEWAELRRVSEAFLVPWEPAWGPKELARTSYRQRLRAYARAMLADESYPFLIFPREHGPLLGGLTLNNVRRGVTQSCALGYWIGAPHARQGFMSDAVAASLRFAFDTLHLHRVEAACVPTNEASRRLLEKAGFRHEGYAREYHRINGVWEDHLLFGILVTDFSPAAP